MTSANPTGGSKAWTLAPVTGTNSLTGVFCPSTSLCVAFDAWPGYLPGGGNVVTSTNPTGGGGAWSVGRVAGINALLGVSCASATLCVAVDSAGNVATSTNPSGGSGAWTTFANDNTASCVSGCGGISCPSVSLCVAVDFTGNVVTSTNPTGGSGAWAATKVDSTALRAVSCASQSLCVAIDYNGRLVTSSDPTGGSGAWTVTILSRTLQSVSCASASLCVAVDNDGNVWTSTNPTGRSGAWTSTNVDGTNVFTGVSCASPTLCVASDTSGNVVTSTNPTGGSGAWTVTNIDGTSSLLGVSCASGPLCVAIDGLNALSSTNPTVGNAAWTQTSVAVSAKVVDFDSLSAVACPSASLCVTVGRSGFAYVATPTGPQHALNASLAGPGTGTVSGSGIDCPGQCSRNYAARTEVTLTATPALGSTFSGWSGGGCSGTGNCKVSLATDSAVTATFDASSQPALRVSFSGTGAGTVIGPGISCPPQCSHNYTSGTPVTLTATPATGSTFAGWYGGGCTGTGSCQTTVNSDTPVTAIFDMIPPDTHTLMLAPTGNGSGTLSGVGIFCPGRCAQTYLAGTTVSLTATPSPGSKFTDWSGGGCSGTRGCDVTLNTDVTVAPTFDLAGPDVTPRATINVTDNAATLEGAVNPNAAAVTDCHFDIGTDTSYGLAIPCSQPPGSGTAPVPVSADVGGLTSGTPYHYRLVAKTMAGTSSTSDATFTTLGASAPSVMTGGVNADWLSEYANFDGVVNPHNSETHATFYYGPTSVSVSSSADLKGYPYSVTVDVGGGTVDVPVSTVPASITIPRNTVYYYRLVASNSHGTKIGAERSFELSPPTPSNTSPPFLQDSDGFDPSKGFDLKCDPGRWVNDTGAYNIRWVHIQPNGSTQQAYGPTRTISSPGDVYHVTEKDVGRPLTCFVAAKNFDGNFDFSGSVQADTFLPLAPKEKLPQWFKTIFNTALRGYMVYDLVDTARDCFEFADVPFFGEALCIAHIVGFVLATTQKPFNTEVDPPDQSYRIVPLLGPGPRLALSNSCPKRIAAARCARLRRAAEQYARETSSIIALQNVLFVAENRFLIARRRHDARSEAAQTVAFKTYFGLLGAAMQAQHRTGLALAREVRRDRITITKRIPGQVLTAALTAGTPTYRALIKHLMTAGVTRATLGQALARFRLAVRHAGNSSFDLTHALTTPTPMLAAPFAREYDTLGLNDLGTAISAFADQHAVARSAAMLLYRDLDQARAACKHQARASSLHKLLADAKHAMRVPYLTLLSAAAQPLISGQSNTDAYRHC